MRESYEHSQTPMVKDAEEAYTLTRAELDETGYDPSKDHTQYLLNWFLQHADWGNMRAEVQQTDIRGISFRTLFHDLWRHGADSTYILALVLGQKILDQGHDAVEIFRYRLEQLDVIDKIRLLRLGDILLSETSLASDSGLARQIADVLDTLQHDENLLVSEVASMTDEDRVLANQRQGFVASRDTQQGHTSETSSGFLYLKDQSSQTDVPLFLPDVAQHFQQVFNMSQTEEASQDAVEMIKFPEVRYVLDGYSQDQFTGLYLMEQIASLGVFLDSNRADAAKLANLVEDGGVNVLRTTLLDQFITREGDAHIFSYLHENKDAAGFIELITALGELVESCDISYEQLAKGASLLDQYGDPDLAKTKNERHQQVVRGLRSKLSRAAKAFELYLRNPDNPARVLAELRSVSLELAVEMQQWRQTGEVNPDLYHVVSANQLSETARQSILAEYEKIWGSKPEMWAKLKARIKEGFADTSGATRYYLYGNPDHPSSFVQFRDLDDQRVHASAYVVPELMKKIGLGSYNYFTSTDVEAQSKIILAECDPKSPASTRYFEKGFVGLGQIDFAGIPALKIARNESLRTQLPSKSYTPEVLLDSNFDDHNITVVTFPGLAETSYDLLATPGVGLTRSFQHPDGQQWVLVFEQLPTDYDSVWAEAKDDSNI